MADIWSAVVERARTFAGAYVLFVGAIVVAVAASWSHNRWVLLAGFAVLALAASRLHEVVRDEPSDGRRRRVLVGLVQLAAGVVLVVLVVWLSASFWGADGAFLLGAALALMAAGGLVAELRGVEGPGPRRPERVAVFGGAVTLLAAVVLDGWAFVLFAAGALVVCGVLLDLRARSRRWWGRPGVVLLVGAVVLLGAAALVDGRWFVGLALAGIVAGELGTELLSEDSHRWLWRGVARWLVAALGAALLVVGGGLFVWLGAEPWHALYLVLGLLVVAWMASSDSDSLILVGLVALALVWTATPRDAEPDDRRVAHAGEAYFLVLGDSFASGEGAATFHSGTNTTDENADHTNECRQAPTAWSLRLARYGTDDTPDRALFLACSGAVTANIDTEPRLVDGRPAGPAELELFRRHRDGEPEGPEAALGQPEFVLVQIGGNDARFGDIGQACVGPGSCAELGQQFLDDLAEIGDDLDGAYQRIRAEVDEDVPIIAVPYPVPLSATNVCDDVLLNGDESRFVDGFVRQLNQVVESAAARNGLLYMEDMEGALRDNGTALCDETGVGGGMNFLALHPKAGSLNERLNPRNWTHNSLHPTAAGHEAMHDTARAWFEAHDLQVPDREPDDDHQVAALDTLFYGDRQIEQCAPPDDRSCATEDYAWHLGQLHHDYRTAVVPLALVMIGAWLFLSQPLCFARKRQISLAKTIRATLTPEKERP